MGLFCGLAAAQQSLNQSQNPKSRWAVLWCRCESEVSVKNSFIGGVDEGPGKMASVESTPHTKEAMHNFDAVFVEGLDAICLKQYSSFGADVYSPRAGDF